MSSTQIQLDRDREVSVQTQSITARSSVRNGTRRKLETTDQMLVILAEYETEINQTEYLYSEKHVHEFVNFFQEKGRHLVIAIHVLTE